MFANLKFPRSLISHREVALENPAGLAAGSRVQIALRFVGCSQRNYR